RSGHMLWIPACAGMTSQWIAACPGSPSALYPPNEVRRRLSSLSTERSEAAPQLFIHRTK
ncbi:MAG TPA: hypothetical protein PKL48_14190, partial [Thermodesulfobacteriota bacterium]|nr:hypothetical protein [Thermodesulfobacteriota bacterium]